MSKTWMSWLARLSVPALAALAIGCGSDSNASTDDSGDSPKGASGIASSKTLSEVTDADKKKFCDWTATLYGGYGKAITCPENESITGPEDLATCLAQGPQIKADCTVTVAQSEACIRAFSTCDKTDDAVCVALVACYQ